MTATRGQFAAALYNSLGISSPSSTGTFSDAGELDGVVSTLSDLGVTTGVGGGKFGTNVPITRGQAFTMMARALGLAGPGDNIAVASQALVDAGIVKGYGETGELGLNDPLKPEHMGLLMDRMGPELAKADPATGETVQDRIISNVSDAADTSMARENPAWAAFLQAQGLRAAEIDDEIALRQELFQEDARRRSDTYMRATDQAIKGQQTDFENRGLFRSGARLQREADTRQRIGFQQEQEQYAAQRAQEELQRRLEQQRNQLNRDTASRRVQMGVQDEQETINDA